MDGARARTRPVPDLHHRADGPTGGEPARQHIYPAAVAGALAAHRDARRGRQLRRARDRGDRAVGMGRVPRPLPDHAAPVLRLDRRPGVRVRRLHDGPGGRPREPDADRVPAAGGDADRRRRAPPAARAQRPAAGAVRDGPGVRRRGDPRHDGDHGGARARARGMDQAAGPGDRGSLRARIRDRRGRPRDPRRTGAGLPAGGAAARQRRDRHLGPLRR